MFTVRENGIVNSTVVITRRMIGEFRRADGWISIVRYERFERPPHRETNTPNSTYKKKGQHSLVESVALKAPQSFCMIATYATPSRRDVQHRESLFLAEQVRWMRRSNCHRRSWEVLAKSWLWPWIWRCWRSWPWSPGPHKSVATTSADAHAWNNATHKNRGCPPLGRNPLAKLRPMKSFRFLL